MTAATPHAAATAAIHSRKRIAIVSFLFNWPSTGGGNIHTVELAQFLARGGYDVRLVAPRYAGWNIGFVDPDCPFPVHLVSFSDADWNLPTIQHKLRAFVDDFAPDAVIVTDSWNVKPHLYHALRHYRVFLRMQAQECLCPLNNLRLRPAERGLELCPDQQLADPDACRVCLIRNERTSGELHRLERILSGVGSDAYRDRLADAFRNAEAVLALNPLVADALRPHCGRVEVVTWGMDGARFPSPGDADDQPLSRRDGTVRLLFAGLVRESIKGYHVLRAACARLWRTRRDLEVFVTDDATCEPAPFERFVGWQSQSELPRWYRWTDVTVVPTIAPDGLSRTSVEAMASGRPVIGSDIGGLPFTVNDGVTGLLFEPGNPEALAAAVERLADDPERRAGMGEAGRREFERRFLWESVIETSYRPLIESESSTHKTAPATRRLEIGPGSSPLPGFETLDVTGESTHRACWGEDRLADVVPAGSCGEVYASHVLEHVPWNRTLKALRDVYEVLAPGGTFEVWVPDFEYVVDCYRQRRCGDDWRRDNAEGDPMLWVNGRIFTWGPGPDNRHRACFDYEHLSRCLSRAGFVAIRRLPQRTRGASHGPIDLGITCRKPADREQRIDP